MRDEPSAGDFRNALAGFLAHLVDEATAHAIDHRVGQSRCNDLAT